MILALRRALSIALLAAPLGAASVLAQAAKEPVLPVPYNVGERAEYTVFFGKLKVGNGSVELLDIQDVRGRDTWHAVFQIHGGLRFVYHIDDTFETWIDRRTGNTLRFHKDQNEGRRERESTYEMFPERAQFIEQGDTAEAGVKDPLDDAAFLYFVRTIPLQVGETYSFDRYFKPDRNPVTIKVLRKDTVSVAGRTWPAIVVQPIIKTPGVFSENGHAEVWLSDDKARIMLQMKSGLPFGSINLYLTSFRPATAPNTP
jgi:Protein of unknown function (DUF3108)